MATTQCLRVATYLPTTVPAIGDAVQVTQVTPLATHFIEIAGGSFPVAVNPGDLLRADATLNWVTAPANSLVPDAIRAGDLMTANAQLKWASVAYTSPVPAATAEGDVMQVDASLKWIAAPLDGGAV